MSINQAQFPAAIWNGLAPGREDRLTDRGPQSEDFDQLAAEVIAVQEAVQQPYAGLDDGPLTALDDGETLVAVHAAGKVVSSTFTFADFEIAMTDAGAAGIHGSAKLVDFPEGNLLLLGIVTNLTIASQTADGTGLDTGAAVVAAIGTVPTAVDNATLTSTEANILASTAATLTTFEGALATQNTAVVFIDGTGTALDAYLNFAAADAECEGSDVLVVNGTITLTWIVLGDN